MPFYATMLISAVIHCIMSGRVRHIDVIRDSILKSCGLHHHNHQAHIFRHQMHNILCSNPHQGRHVHSSGLSLYHSLYTLGNHVLPPQPPPSPPPTTTTTTTTKTPAVATTTEPRAVTTNITATIMMI